jgi:hypothetical protein
VGESGMKGMDTKKILIIVASLIITFGTLYVSNNIYYTFKHQRPLESFLNNSDYVKEFDFSSKEKTLVIELNQTMSLMEAALVLEKNIVPLVPMGTKIIYKDNSSKTLDNLYIKYHLDIYESILTSRLGNLGILSEDIYITEGIDSKFETDGERLFVMFTQDDYFKIIIINIKPLS